MFKIRYKGFKIAQVRHQWIILNNKLVFSFKITQPIYTLFHLTRENLHHLNIT